jgi:hypothetical protein
MKDEQMGGDPADAVRPLQNPLLYLLLRTDY